MPPLVNPLDGPAPNSLTDFVMIAPLSLDPAIFPWGPRLLLDFAKSREPERRCEFWDLRVDDGIRTLAEQNRRWLCDLFIALPSDQRVLFMGHTQNPLLLYDVAVALGSQAIPEHCVRDGVLGHQLDRLRDAHRSLFATTAASFLSSARRQVFAISVYDYTITGALTCAHQLKALSPGCEVILGGDYLDEPIAKKIVESLSIIDGAVVGYGEEALTDLLAFTDRGGFVADFVYQNIITRRGRSRSHGVHVQAPAHYVDMSVAAPVSYAALDRGKIRVLAQRGCSWGECTFCSQIDRRSYYQIRSEDVLAQIQKLVASTPPEEANLHVSVDSDENDIGRIIPLADTLAQALAGIPANIQFWLMVRSFRVELCVAALRLKPRIRFEVRLNIESLNFQRLRLMKKGFSPLQAIEAMKALLDCDQLVSTNYFAFYPGENGDESAKQEARLLSACSHLLLDHRVNIAAFPYAMNGRDTVADDPARFGMQLVRLPGDNWVARAFGIDLPFTIWAYEFTPDQGCPEIVQAEMQWYGLRKQLSASRAGLSALGHHLYTADNMRHLLAGDVDNLKRASETLYELCSKAENEGRALRISVLNALETARGRSGASVSERLRAYLPNAELRIEKARILQRAVGSTDGQSMQLEREDLAILRYLYWTRRSADVVRRFPISETRVRGLIERGWVVEERGHLLSVVSDPDYWHLDASEQDAPARLLTPERRVPAQAA